MHLKDLQKNWDEFGKTDPLWAIYTADDKKGNKWDPQEFFQTGRHEIGVLMEYLGSLKVSFRRGKALDFGCGVGRMTQALADYFDEVSGVDIASSMIELARRYNRHGNRCKYFLNEVDDLRLFPSDTFDFVFTTIVLQHMEPRYSKKYIEEFVRVLAPQGLLVFQIPSHLEGGEPESAGPKGLRETIRSYLPRSLVDFCRSLWARQASEAAPQDTGEPLMEMYGVPRKEVEALLTKSGAKIIDVVDNKDATQWIGYQYYVTKV